jgi:hypothetical protein
MNKRLGWLGILWGVLILLPATPAWAEEGVDSNWPREIVVSNGVVVMYQPEPEKLKGNRLEGRAAVAVEQKGQEPVFGAVWFEARLETNREKRTATILDLSITQLRFPKEEKAKRLSKLLEKEIPKWQLPIALDELLATLDLEQTRIEATDKISVEPPKILVANEPSVLVSLDGQPHTLKEKGSGLMRVVNTPFTMLFDPASKTYYLYADTNTWYTANNWRGEWKLTGKVPRKVAELAPEVKPEDKDKDADKPGPAPRIIVATEPTELIVINGKPKFSTLPGVGLLYLSNSDSDVLMDIETNVYYILLAGRWYAAKRLQGPWRYVPGDKLPVDFLRIPEDSEMGTVLYAVPGTQVAKEALLDAQIPQTATVDRKKATLTVEYDGQPKFADIKGTNLFYVINTATPVIMTVNHKYYACDDAVWFVADSVNGPWKITIEVPDEIYTIPPDSPMYHVTFVKVYGSTPEVVYVGYLPGYTGTYVYHTSIVYGTGYYWPGWYGRYYYPRPVTWGYHVRWNPWYGWSFGFSYSNGPFTFTIGRGGWYRGGWWGGGRYRGYHRGYRHGRRAGYRAGYRAGRRHSSRTNIYRGQRNNQRVKATSSAPGRHTKGTAAGKRANNVFTDRDGNIHRKTDKGWEKRTKEGWKGNSGKQGKPSQRPTQKPSKQPSDTSRVGSTQKRTTSTTKSQTAKSSSNRQLERSYNARQHGRQRTQSYNHSRSSGSSRGSVRGGGRRGGGGRGGGRR